MLRLIGHGPRYLYVRSALSKIQAVLNRAKDSDLCDDLFGLYADINKKIDIPLMSHMEIVITLSWHSFGIICNGGFRYLFAGEFNGDPGFKITANTFKIINAENAYQAFKSALALFGSDLAPLDREDRLRIFDSQPAEHISGINGKFFDSESEIIQALAAFIRNNRLLIEDDLNTRLTRR